MFNRFLSIISILFIFLLIVGYCCFYSKMCWQWAIAQGLTHYGYQVKSCKIGTLVIRKSPDSYLQNLELEIVKDDLPISLSIADLRVQTEWPLKEGKLFVSGLNINSEIVSATNAGGRFDFKIAENNVKVNGPITVTRLTAAGYEINGVTLLLSVENKKARLEPLQAAFYGGEVAGKILLESQEKITYSIDLNFYQIDLHELADVNPGLFGQVGGVMDGALAVKGEGSAIHSMKSSFAAPAGGEMKAVLFSYIFNYIPGNTQERKILEKLIQANAMVPLNQFDVDIDMVNDQQLSLNFDLESKRLNLKPHVTVDVNLDETLSKWVAAIGKNLQRLLPKGE